MSEQRKNDHIDLAIKSQVDQKRFDFNYEPMLSGHPKDIDLAKDFLGFKLGAPIWFSSMTGGAQDAQVINTNLAKICDKYKLGMGLGSCRSLLNSDKRLSDFDIKQYMPNSPLYTNLGIAQLEEILSNGQVELINQLQSKLSANGLIIHVNPLQEWAQPEGDRYYRSPVELIEKLLAATDIPIIVKEVGQGMGPRSLKALCKLDLAAIEFAAFGGTNFTMLEKSRHLASNSGRKTSIEHLAYIGHTKDEMISYVNSFESKDIKCRDFIISGGIKSSVDGFRFSELLRFNNLIGLGSVLLKHAKDFNELDEFIHQEIENLKLANCFFEVNKK